MAFSWDDHPRALQATLQYVEDHKDRARIATRAELWDLVNQIKAIDPTRSCRDLKPDNIIVKLQSILKDSRREPELVYADLWKNGPVRALNLAKLGCTITSTGASIDAASTIDEEHRKPQPGAVKKRKFAEDQIDDEPQSKQSGKSLHNSKSTEDSKVKTTLTARKGDKKKPKTVARTKPLTRGKQEKGTCKETSDAANQREDTHQGDDSIQSGCMPAESRDSAAILSQNPGGLLEEHEFSDPPGKPVSPSMISHKMNDLAIKIQTALRREIKRRSMDKTAAFRIDESNFDAASTVLLNDIFGQGSITSLKQKLQEAQTHRRLTLDIFLTSFIAASVTRFALDVPPQGHLATESAEYQLFELLLSFPSRHRNDKEAEDKDVTKKDMEYARSWALRNYILSQVMPKIGQKAAVLAEKLYMQILPFFTVPASSTESWVPVRTEGSSYPRVASKLTPGDRELNEGSSGRQNSTKNVPTAGSFKRDLTTVFEAALTVRAEWEAQGEGIYQCLFPTFGTQYRIGHHLSFDTMVDHEKPNQVFVSTLPGIWVRYRDSLVNSWSEPKFVMSATVFLMHQNMRG